VPNDDKFTKFTPEDLESTLRKLRMLQYFPGDAATAILLYLRDMVPHKEALDFLVSTLINRVGYWPGPKECRGIVCSRYDAADGIDAYCSLPGFTAEEAEAQFLLKEADQKKPRQQIADSSRQFLAEALKAKPTTKRRLQ
jgi:hypothetical protein